MAARTTFLSALSAWLAAPEPRPPQPTSPTFNVPELPAAKRLPGRMAGAAKALPMAAEVLRKSRRVVSGVSGLFIRGIVVGDFEPGAEGKQIEFVMRKQADLGYCEVEGRLV